MGAPIAANLAAAGYDVRLWNRTRARAEAVAGVAVADAPAEAVDGAQIVITMLSDADAVLATFEAARDAIEPSALWIEMSPLGLVGVDECMKAASQRGVGFVDAPMLGTKGPAEQGALVVLASGPEDLRPRCQPSASGRCGSGWRGVVRVSARGGR